MKTGSDEGGCSGISYKQKLFKRKMFFKGNLLEIWQPPIIETSLLNAPTEIHSNLSRSVFNSTSCWQEPSSTKFLGLHKAWQGLHCFSLTKWVSCSAGCSWDYQKLRTTTGCFPSPPSWWSKLKNRPNDLASFENPKSPSEPCHHSASIRKNSIIDLPVYWPIISK